MSIAGIPEAEESGLVDKWFAQFSEAMEGCDGRAVASLLETEGHWRDILAFTWDLRSVSGRNAVAAALEAHLDEVRPHQFALTGAAPIRVVERAGRRVFETLFTFETSVGRCKGVARLVSAGDSLAAWSIMTALQDIRGHEEHVGARRPDGHTYSRRFGGDNWLDRRQATEAYLDRDPTVLVIGGGQCGLAIAARLNQLDIDTLVVDRHERVGDNWRRRYHSLTLHNQTWVNDLPYLPFPQTFPVYLPKDKLANWFEFYVDAMEINYWTSTEFESASYDKEAGNWTAVVRRHGKETTLRPRHLVMATGVSAKPFIPDLPGLSEFAGRTMHSSYFTRGSDYVGKRAIVIGSGNSAHDVAQDLYEGGAADVTMFQRGSITVADVESAQAVYALYSEGLPTPDADLVLAASPYPVQVASYQRLTDHLETVDAELIRGLKAAGMLVDMGEDRTGFQMKYLRRGGGYYLNVGCSDLIIEGKIGVRQFADIDRVVPRGIQMRDGSVVDADVLVLATGYHSQQDLVRSLLGDSVADRVGPVWGFDAGGELRNMWKRTNQAGLWFHAGSLAQSRIFSKYLALQIQACELGILPLKSPHAADGSGEVDLAATV